jgi:hypothetical protein
VPKILFYRDFRRFTGGDLKVWDYFNHVRATPGWEPYVRFYGESVWDETNPWNSAREHVLDPDVALEPDAHFVSGVDWRQIDGAVRPDSPIPVVNLVQHVKHADTSDTLLRHRFLPHKAIRICVSPEVAQAIEAAGTVRGPVFTIPDAIEVASLERLGSAAARDLDVVVAANKQPEMGAEVMAKLDAPGRRVELLDTRIPRDQLLGRLARARVAVFVPNPEEGFYLPAVEAMALGTLVVCPDCVGNRSFCEPGVNCFRPPWEVDAIVAQAEQALATPDAERLVEAAHATARGHDLAGERAAFQGILRRLDELWAD